MAVSFRVCCCLGVDKRGLGKHAVLAGRGLWWRTNPRTNALDIAACELTGQAMCGPLGKLDHFGTGCTGGDAVGLCPIPKIPCRSFSSEPDLLAATAAHRR